MLRRYVDGIEGEAFFQKRAPTHRPDWMQTVELRFPSGRKADELVVSEVSQLVWIVNLGNIDLNPHPVRTSDMEHPDELRVDLDPGPGVTFAQVKRVAMVAREVLHDHGLVGWPKTSGSRGMHVNVRLEPRWGFDDVRRAALALAREVERRAPEDASSAWWKEERHGVFVDYNQNAKDRTVASVFSVRPTPDARVSMPLAWDDVPDCEPGDFTLATVPELLARHGDPGAGIDDAAGSLEGLLELADRQAAEGMADAPWPPHYAKGEDEPRRAPPSKRKKAGGEDGPKKAKTSASGRRKSKFPLIVVAKAQRQEDALAGLERWKERHPEAAALLEPEDVLVDQMRGRSSTWTRIRLNLRHVPEAQRPPEEPPDPDWEPSWGEWEE